VLHAELIKTLDRLGAKSIVFDISFDRPWNQVATHPAAQEILIRRFGYPPAQLTGPAVDALLSNAIHVAGCDVILGAERVTTRTERA
jgi:CHASE2 domain-containing sensor protein